MNRFFVKLQQIHNQNITFDKDQSKKIRKVLRLKKGDYIETFDGKGWIYLCKLEKVTNDFSIAKVESQELFENSSSITLIQALPKNLKIEFILQKCTELGVDKIILFESEFSQENAKKISEEKVKRWRKIVIHAAEQAKRVFIPEVELITENLERIVENYQHAFFLDFDGKFLGLDSLNIDSYDHSVNFLVGPEGGFSPKEKEILNKFKFTPIKIATNILRSETAGVAFLAQLELLRNLKSSIN